jgi:[ribosomal protein S5]-alanine N-acetyltransferase
MSDTIRLSAIGSDKEIAKNVGDTFPHPYTLQDAEWWVTIWSQKENSRMYGIYIDDIYAWNIWREQNQTGRFFHNIHLWYRLWREYWWRWIMTSIVKECIKHIFNTISSCHRIYAKVYSRNQWSKRVLEKSWLTLESHRKESIRIEWERYDEYEYALVKNQ